MKRFALLCAFSWAVAPSFGNFVFVNSTSCSKALATGATEFILTAGDTVDISALKLIERLAVAAALMEAKWEVSAIEQGGAATPPGEIAVLHTQRKSLMESTKPILWFDGSSFGSYLDELSAFKISVRSDAPTELRFPPDRYDALFRKRLNLSAQSIAQRALPPLVPIAAATNHVDSETEVAEVAEIEKPRLPLSVDAAEEAMGEGHPEAATLVSYLFLNGRRNIVEKLFDHGLTGAALWAWAEAHGGTWRSVEKAVLAGNF